MSDPRAPGHARLGPYEVLGELGRGGMAVVLRARDPAGREVAIKALHHAVDSAALERFRHEGQTLAGLDHPGVLEVHAVLEERGQPPRLPRRGVQQAARRERHAALVRGPRLARDQHGLPRGAGGRQGARALLQAPAVTT